MADPIRCPTKEALVVDRENAHCATYLCRVPREHTLADVLKPEYFGRHQNRTQQDKLIRTGDFIDVQPEDYTWYARLMVRACVPNVDQVITVVIYQKDFPVDGLAAGWTMEHRGALGWTIFFQGNEKDAGFLTPEAARQRINYFAAQGQIEAEAPAPVEVKAKPGKKAKSDETPAPAPVVEAAEA